MSDKKMWLTTDEQRELSVKARELLQKINSMKPEKRFQLAAIEKLKLAEEPKEKREIFLREKVDAIFGKGSFNDIYQLIRILWKLYKHSKAKDDTEFSTHEYITEKAMDLLSIQDEKVRKIFLKGCVKPDIVLSGMFDLFQEGHFYGPLSDNSGFGNYIRIYFGPKVLPVLINVKKFLGGKDEDIYEEAISNFRTHYGQYLADRDLKEMGISIHYIQDITAPHHIQNIPSFLPQDDKDTHVIFERKAKTFLKNNTINYDPIRFNAFKIKLKTTPQKYPKSFANEIRQLAWPHAQRIDDANQWDDIVKETIPIAVYATARVLETRK